ncbi:MAG: hypothetical protein JWO41_232 [Candidatus Saccharibacteria bacterium]|nr:hypothetical protein [Candidatus Saccharibacteria bacterium]
MSVDGHVLGTTSVVGGTAALAATNTHRTAWLYGGISVLVLLLLGLLARRRVARDNG